MSKLDHVALPVSDLDAAIRFYTEKLGLKLLFRELDPAHHEAFAFLELTGGNLELLQALDEQNKARPFARPPIQPPYCPHVAMQTADMDQLVARLEQNGVPIVKGPMEIAGSVRWVYTHDPDNNIIEFVQWL